MPDRHQHKHLKSLRHKSLFNSSLEDRIDFSTMGSEDWTDDCRQPDRYWHEATVCGYDFPLLSLAKATRLKFCPVHNKAHDQYITHAIWQRVTIPHNNPNFLSSPSASRHT
jgi:hypothetical protein